MKKENKIVAFGVVALLMLQSCSHIVSHVESDYTPADSPYPTASMKFSYYANKHTLSSSLTEMGNRIHSRVTADASYKSALPSAVEYEGQYGQDKTRREVYDRQLAVASKVTFSSKDEHKAAIQDAKSVIDNLSRLQSQDDLSDFLQYWKRIYQLSHRGIIQHYMTADAAYSRLSASDRSLLYGYLLNKDISECVTLAQQKSADERSALSKLKSDIAAIRDKHQKLLDEEIQREKERQLAIEREKREKERREREIAAQREREEASRRADANRQNLSWLEGHWRYTNNYYTTNVYIDGDKLKIYIRRLGDNSYPNPDYNGRFRYVVDYDRGYDAIVYENNRSYILVDPSIPALLFNKGQRFTKAY